MSSKKMKKYTLETKKAVVQAKIQGMKETDIIKKFQIKHASYIYDWMKKFKITHYPGKKKHYSLETKKAVVQAKIQGMSNPQIIKKFQISSKSVIKRCMKQFQITHYPSKELKYSLETRKAVIQAKLQGMKDKEIVKKFGLNTHTVIYKWLKQFKITHYPGQKHYYSFDTKIKVVLAKQAGWTSKKIQAHFGIQSRWQIRKWYSWFKQQKLHHLSQPRGKNYRYQKKFYHPFFDSIKKEIKKILALKPKNNPQLYLKIITKYAPKVGLNQLLKWLNFPKSTYYRWLKGESKEAVVTVLDLALQKIAKRHRDFNSEGEGRYLLGYRRLHCKLKLVGFKVNPKTVYRKMKKFGCLCQTPKNSFFLQSYKRQKNGYEKPLARFNLLQNNFRAQRPYQKLCGDFTYLPYGENNQFLYLAVIMDLYNREIIAYTFSEQQDHHLISQTLKKLPVLKEAGLFHSDQGVQFIHQKIKTILQEKNLIPSFSEKQAPQQNSCVESFFSTLKNEKMFNENKKRLTFKRIKRKVTRFIEYYNRKRRLKYLNYLSPYQFKQKQIQIL
ncbi:IS3 family transposase ['Cynodon dactylon' phytoplasma]|uniref:IS3 family transposase n=1 Tax='Cynodon dactylon' phytoplasma TaxID=295320 RepID=UPI001265D36B|nr:IS3 family transposase ['Cynodon dactylon' phytoplasma]KAB8121693.1 IS3 family transposase ['Cynodon dactylon' phytoplasma]